MDTITLILIIGLAAQGLAFAALILAGPLYAWNDRWLDRTHRRVILAEPPLCVEWRLPFRGGAEHDRMACDRDSPLGEEQSTTKRRATETPL